MPALIISPEGDISEDELPEHGEFARIQQLMGGEPEGYVLTARLVLWGSRGSAQATGNQLAVSLAARFGYAEYFAGPAVVTGYADVGQAVNLTGDQVDVLRAMVRPGKAA
jgi:hypothetical protein